MALRKLPGRRISREVSLIMASVFVSIALESACSKTAECRRARQRELAVSIAANVQRIGLLQPKNDAFNVLHLPGKRSNNNR